MGDRRSDRRERSKCHGVLLLGPDTSLDALAAGSVRAEEASHVRVFAEGQADPGVGMQ